MKIAVSIITLNEKDYIKQALASCTFADCIYLLDGGSTDRTIQKAMAGAKEAKTELVYKTKDWADHFGDQRQHALRLVADDVDWWLRLDADEIYPPLFQDNIRDLLANLAENVMATRIRQMNLIDKSGIYSSSRGGWETWPRIFRNVRHQDKPAWEWLGQIHEYCRLMTLQGLVDPKTVSLNLSVNHYGWLSEERRQDREELYLNMPGSGFEPGSLTKRTHQARLLPSLALESSAE